jgi:hypothetical protein
MKYQWIEEEVTAGMIERETGLKVKNIITGRIIAGYDGEDEHGNPMPIHKRGIEIEFETEPSVNNLEKLDRKFIKLKRDGGKDLTQEIEKIKARVANLEVR